jgi:ThiF family
MELTPVEAERYARHLSIPALGPAGQARIRDARVHVVGAGAAAGPALLSLAQAGVGALFIDDGDDVAADDEGAWLYTPDRVGEPRLLAALEPVRRANSLVRVRPHATGSEASATLIFASSRGVALLASDRARLAGQPHVVATAYGDGGRVVSVPTGSPCFRCAGRPATGARPAPGASAVVGLLGALELLLIVSGLVTGPAAGRCIDLVHGQPQVRATIRRPRCECITVY